MIGDDLTGPFLLEMRAHALSRSLDTFMLQVSLGMRYDKDLGRDVEAFEDIFQTPGFIVREGGAGTLTQEVGGRTTTTITRTLHIPTDSPSIPANASALIVATHPTTDASLRPGMRLILEAAIPGSQTPTRAIKVTEVIA